MPIDEAVVPIVAEVDRLRLHNLILQQQVCREQLNLLTMQFLQTAQPKTLQQRIDDATEQINAMAAKIFGDAKLDPQRYQFNVEDGAFVERPSNG